MEAGCDLYGKIVFSIILPIKGREYHNPLPATRVSKVTNDVCRIVHSTTIEQRIERDMRELDGWLLADEAQHDRNGDSRDDLIILSTRHILKVNSKPSFRAFNCSCMTVQQ